MPIDRPLRVLTIGHSYVVALNRAVARKTGEDPAFDVTIAALSFFQGDLRPMHLESEPDGSKIRVVPIDAQLTRFIHLFWYNHATLNDLLAYGKFDIVHSWEEPYISLDTRLPRLSVPGSHVYVLGPPKAM